MGVLSQTFTFHYTYITKKGNNRQNINNFLPRVNFSIQMDNLEIPEMDQTNQPVEIVEEFVKIDFESPSNSKLPEILITLGRGHIIRRNRLLCVHDFKEK